MATISVAVERPKAGPRPRVGRDIFPIEGRITCRACEAEEVVPLNHPALLCGACLADLPLAARRVAEAYAAAMETFFQASAALAEAAEGDEWFAKTERARAEIEPAAFARAWEKARAAGGKKAALVALRDAMDEAALDMRRAELRYIAAAPELVAARAAKQEPVDV